MAEGSQTIVTQKGDRLLDLVRRVYQIRDQDRILAAAMAVTAATAQNRVLLNNRFGQPLDAGLSIEFPPWPEVEASMRRNDARRHELQQQMNDTPQTGPHKLAIAPQMKPATMRPVGIVRSSAVGERSSVKELGRALGLSAAQAADNLLPASVDDLDLSRTRSAHGAKLIEYGRALGTNVARQTLHELFSGNDKAFHQAFELLLRTQNPRAFPSNVDPAPSVSLLLEGVFLAFSQRLVREGKDEITRRHRLVQRVLLRPEPRDKIAAMPSPSQAFAGQSGAELLGEVERLAKGEAPDTLTPGVVQQLKQQYGLLGSPQDERLLLPAMQSALGYVGLLDQLHAGGSDGALAQLILDLGTRVSDAHKQALQDALRWLDGQSVDAKLGPNEALAKVLSEVLKRMHERRAGASHDEQDRQLADERHLLSGRNFLSFRKDVCQALDKRLTMAAQLSAEQRVAVLLALLIQDGHRLTTLRPEDIETTCERFVQATNL